uniref:2OGFeDO JBP1/TET oxygenase domain-containing protein n=1 Tax=viral metagenome TaxID=1070528 RepID=A0A6C0I472_9ZZZZ
MIIKKEKKGSVVVYHVDKEYDDETMEKKMNSYIEGKDIKTIIDHDADVFTKDGRLLLRFRKGALETDNIDAFYDNIISFARNKSNNRGNATGGRNKKTKKALAVMSNIFGYFDTWSPSQKLIFKKSGKKPKLMVRKCRFNMDYPEKYEKTIPLIKEIDTLYSELTPEQYKAQYNKAKETYFRIPGTSFTTITTNVNYQTTIHTDKGDDEEGFGNLAVIERGDYDGGETCFPQYGVGVDVRTRDILFMDVHQPHANLPIKKESEDTVRMSIVCYLRQKVWANTRNKSENVYKNHIRFVNNITRKKKKKEKKQ